MKVRSQRSSPFKQTRERSKGGRSNERVEEGNDQSFILNPPHRRTFLIPQPRPVDSVHTADVNSHPCGPKDSSCSLVGEY